MFLLAIRKTNSTFHFQLHSWARIFIRAAEIFVKQIFRFIQRNSNIYARYYFQNETANMNNLLLYLEYTFSLSLHIPFDSSKHYYKSRTTCRFLKSPHWFTLDHANINVLKKERTCSYSQLERLTVRFIFNSIHERRSL